MANSLYDDRVGIFLVEKDSLKNAVEYFERTQHYMWKLTKAKPLKDYGGCNAYLLLSI